MQRSPSLADPDPDDLDVAGDEPMRPGRDARVAWRIHWGALAALLVFNVVLFWDPIFGPPRGGLDLRGFAAMMMLMVLLGYGLVTTVLMVWVSRSTFGPVVLHTLGLGAIVGALWLDAEDSERSEAERARQVEALKRAQVHNCLHLGELRVSSDRPPRATMVVANDCEFAVTIRRSDLSGFAPGAGNVIFDGRREVVTVRPRERVTIDDAAVGPEGDDRQVDASWDWRCHLSIDTPQHRDLCFTTPGAPGSYACERLGRVTIAGR